MILKPRRNVHSNRAIPHDSTTTVSIPTILAAFGERAIARRAAFLAHAHKTKPQ